jgi:hypothetical protein
MFVSQPALQKPLPVFLQVEVGRNLQSNNRADWTIAIDICSIVEKIVRYLSTVNHDYVGSKCSSVKDIACLLGHVSDVVS